MICIRAQVGVLYLGTLVESALEAVHREVLAEGYRSNNNMLSVGERVR